MYLKVYERNNQQKELNESYFSENIWIVIIMEVEGFFPFFFCKSYQNYQSLALSKVREAMLKTYLDTQLALKGHFQTSDTIMHKTFHLSV